MLRNDSLKWYDHSSTSKSCHAPTIMIKTIAVIHIVGLLNLQGLL